ncbi:transmembrane Fragile-X-F protein [Yersinia alsatica]|uniref:transmembrane Fragile-X-F protein n=1 Tax=Yersinia alsatica TaxID=2890317 RepID=UPI0011A97D54|nr:transmembrane Fragile-X-F protein [Yersinia alsatica]
MSKENKSWTITPLIALGLIFITLKLMGYITWSWWWVTAPFWGGLALWLVIIAVLLMVIGAITHRESKKL